MSGVHECVREGKRITDDQVSGSCMLYGGCLVPLDVANEETTHRRISCVTWERGQRKITLQNYGMLFSFLLSFGDLFPFLLLPPFALPCSC